MSDTRRDALSKGLRQTHHLTGEVWECGVYRGDSALFLKDCLDALSDSRLLRLFDTFAGMPFHSEHDGKYIVGTMADTSFEEVRARFDGRFNVLFQVGAIPATFQGLEDSSISFANIDVDNYDSVKACLDFIYPRMQPGGTVFLDDYACGDCPGARKAVDEFMIGKPETLHHPHWHEHSPQVWFAKQ